MKPFYSAFESSIEHSRYKGSVIRLIIEICGVHGDECLSERQCQNWFARFRSGNFDVKDEYPPGQPIVEKVDEIL